MSYEAIGIIVAILAACGVYLPILLGMGRGVREIAAWRATVDASLERIEGESDTGDRSLGRSLDDLRSRVNQQDGTIQDQASALRQLAETAGRSLGRTEGS